MRVGKCARCGEDHENIEPKKLTRPVVIDMSSIAANPQEIPMFTHWAPCPTNGEPIMILILPDPPR